MKKMIALIAAVLLMMPQTAFAADQEVQEELVYPRLLEEAPEGEASAGRTLDEVSPESLQDETELYLELEGLLKEALMNGQQYIDLQEMQISQQEYSLYEILYFSPYFSNGINISFWYSGSYYTRAQIENSMTVEETRNYFSQVDQKVAAILSQVSDEMSDAEKMLAVHDYFVYEYAYDYDDYLAGTVPADSYRSGGLFMNGVGVCQAYAYGYQYILCKLGLECYVTSSSGMNHAWNIVELDGEYYHVDCTWDDPVADRLGMVRHSYFLLSDETISDVSVTGQAHYGWDLQTQLECTSKTYEDEYWNDAESRVFFEGDSAYYVRRRGVYQRNLSSGNERLLADLGSWYVWDRPSYYVDAYSGLSVYNGDLYYNTRNELRRVSMDGEEDVLIYAPDTENGFVYGSKITGNELQYVIKQAPSEEGEILTAPVSLGTQEPDSIVLWDTRLEMTEGDTAALSYYLVPETAVTEVQWQSDNENVAAVDQSGTVTAVGEGTATVTVTTVNGKEASCQVTVQAAEIPDPEPDKTTNLDYTMTTLDGKTVTTKAEGKPKLLVFFKTTCYNSQTVMRILQDKALTLKGIDVIACDISSETEEETQEFFEEYGRDDMECCFGTNRIMWDYLRSQGVSGTVTLPVLFFIDQENHIAHYTTGLNENVVNDIETYLGTDIRDNTTITLDNTELEMTVGETAQLTYRLDPEDYQGEFEWQSGNPAVATVEDGKVTAVGEGASLIMVWLDNGNEASCRVTVKKPEVPIEAVSLDRQELTLEEGESVQLTATVTPEDTTESKEVAWSSSDENIAAVDQSGTVTAVGEGTATVTVTTVNGKEASCQVTVQAAEIPEPDPDPEVPAELPYQDVGKDAWYYGAVQYAYENGIMTGVNATTFAPGESLARAQFAVILYRMNGEPEVPYSARFHDVGEGIWYTDAILWAADTSVVTGYSNGNFGPGDNINREQMALMMYRYAAHKGYDTSVKADFSQYQDAGRVSDFAREAMQWAVGEQIITGKYDETQLDPQGNASRAECATIMMRFMERYEK